MRMLSFMKRDRLSEKLQSSIFGMEEVYPVHVAAYFGDDDAMDFMIASRADPNKKTSMGRTALAVAREFNTCGILPQKVSSDSFVTFESFKYFMIWYLYTWHNTWHDFAHFGHLMSTQKAERPCDTDVVLFSFAWSKASRFTWSIHCDVDHAEWALAFGEVWKWNGNGRNCSMIPRTVLGSSVGFARKRMDCADPCMVLKN